MGMDRLPSAILGARALYWYIGGMNLESAGEQLHSRRVQCTQLPTYERMDFWIF